MEKSYIQKIIPFIDNMRVGQDEGGDTPVVSLIPFQVGDVLDLGTKICFDTSKGAELEAFMKGIDFEHDIHMIEGMYYMLSGESTNDIIAYIIPMMDSDNNSILLLGTAEGTTGVVYSTFDMVNPQDPSVSITKGWNNGIDETGYVILNDESGTPGYIPDASQRLPITAKLLPVDEINGIIIGKGE